MTLWRVPHKGIPFGLDRDENDPHNYASSFFNSRWWDAEWREKLDATLEKFGGLDRDLENVEGLAILRSDVLEYFPFLSGESSAEVLANEIDPSDSPPELDAANMAFRAVSNGYGNQSATVRNRLIEYLEKHYPSFKGEQVQRIATVANPDKSTGRKKIGKE